ncbi:glutathione S-transferase family protein [Solimicrobium silvestre]|uniref:Glutathione S-transferase n=1 Tax=Solimicrobium silvestre TaxID=2099400 RepID=A0A2S9GT72_9BURK|nr:glutathione S-transferase family protein [Solimicrobium silvestre]PRC90917.1 Glutathione S-transferase [Solimicrobium silvestre]
MSYTLYYSPGTASMAVHWMLIELGVAFETRLVDFESGQQRSPEYLRLNPAGRVPTLVIDGVPYSESTALLMLLAERHPAAALSPAPGTAERCEWMELMVYLANTVLPAMRDWFYADTDGDPIGADTIRNLARSRIEAACERLDKKLADGRTYIVGGKLSTADFLAVMLMRWTRNMPRPAMTWEHIELYVKRLRSLPSFITLNTNEGLTDWQNTAV